MIAEGPALLVQASKEPIGTKGPASPRTSRCPAGSSSTCPAPTTSASAARSRTARSAPACAPWPGDRARGRRRRHHPHRRRGADPRGFEREFNTLHDTWKKIQKRSKSAPAAGLIHREAKLTSGIIRDVFTTKVDALTIEGRKSTTR
jgi:ribonuclease G